MDKVATKVGKIVLNFSLLEMVAASFVSKLIGGDVHIGAIVTAEMSFQNKIKALDSLMRRTYLNKEIVQKWDLLKARMNKCEQERNIYIHSHYINKLDKSIARFKITAKQKSGLKVDWEDFNEESLNNVLDEQFNLINELNQFYEEVFGDGNMLVLPN
jgi:hypothetical protein